MKVLFELFDVPALYICQQAVMSLNASNGRVSGCIIDIGHSRTDIIPVYHNFVLVHASMKMEIAGNEVTNYLSKVLTNRGYNFKNDPNLALLINDLKENICFVQTLENKSTSFTTSAQYECPDGQLISVRDECFECCEVFFEPSLVGKDSIPIQNCIINSIKKCQEDIQIDLLKACVLVGGSSLFRGFQERLQEELNREMIEAEVIALQRRHQASWTGASLIASLATFQSSWICRHEYDVSQDRSLLCNID